MKSNQSRPGKFWAYVAVLTGLGLGLTGLGMVVTYLGFPLLTTGQDVLAAQLGQMAALFLCLICGPLAVYHGVGVIRERSSSRMHLPPMYLFWISFALVVGLGSLLRHTPYLQYYIFPFLFFLGAALPTTAVIAWSGAKIGWPITWRQGILSLIGGATLSILIALILEMILPSILLLLMPDVSYSIGSVYESVGNQGGGGNFLSPLLIMFLIGVALQAPIPEELAKVVPVTLFGRQRINSPQRAFLIGLCAGAGFAILENMLYEGLYAQWSGWSWGGLTVMRGFGSVLHPLCSAIVALGWYRSREQGWQAFAKAYLIAIGLHTLWNGGFDALLFLTGLGYLSGAAIGPSISIYGLSVGVLLVLYLVGLSTGLWLLLRHLVIGLEHKSVRSPALPVEQRAIAIWAMLCLVVILPIGILLSPAWKEIQAFLY